MILGILSDTHGRGEATACALQILHAAGAEALVHCGDVGAATVIDQLAGWRVWLVWGNSDAPGPALTQYATSLGVNISDATPLRLELHGRRLAVFHGHEPEFAALMKLAGMGEEEAFTRAAAADYLLLGHSHVALDARIGGVRIINPGALHRARPLSVATLDLEADRLRFWRVPEPCRGPVLAEWHPAAATRI